MKKQSRVLGKMEGDTFADFSPLLSGSVAIKSPPNTPPRSASPADDKSLLKQNDDRSKSPEPSCAICLGDLKNKSFTNSCLHQFCFDCLLAWSKVKPECPLCKQTFQSIIHNVRSIEDYDQYHLLPKPQPVQPPPYHQENDEEAAEDWTFELPRIRYRTTMTPERRRRYTEISTLTWNTLLPVMPVLTRTIRAPMRLASHRDFRRSVYIRDIWVCPLPDVTGNFRESSPEFYRENEGQVQRLVPWLSRELSVLLSENMGAAVAYELIISLLTRHSINSPEFQQALFPILGHRTQHFIHEFHTFAISPYDMMGFDRSAQYLRRHPVETVINISSSDEVDDDSDVAIISSDREDDLTIQPVNSSSNLRTSPVPGPSHGGAGTSSNILRYLRPNYSDDESNSSRVSPNHCNGKSSKNKDYLSDPDDCTIVSVLKPKHERTPEIIVLDSDTDVVENETVSEEISNINIASPLVCKTEFTHALSPSSVSNSASYFSDSDYVPPSEQKQSKPRRSSTKRKHSCKRIPGKHKSKSVISHTRNCKCKRRDHSCSSDSSDESQDRNARKKRRRIKEIWCINKDSEDSADFSDAFNAPPYTASEIASYNGDHRPKLKSIVIRRSGAAKTDRYSQSPTPSLNNSFTKESGGSQQSSSRNNHRRKRKSHKKDKDKKKREHRSYSSSSSELRLPKMRRKKKKTRKSYLTSSDSDLF